MTNHGVQGTITSCQKKGSKLLFHVDYDDGDSDTEELGAASCTFRWNGPRAASGAPAYKPAMRTAMLALQPQNMTCPDVPADVPTSEVRITAAHQPLLP